MELPQKYDSKEAQKKWQKYWEQNKLYKFNKKTTKKIYSIDTPPPYVSGLMHVGHAFSYSQQDFIARFKRMNGHEVFYPFGTDDNGLPTERLVEKTRNIKSTKMQRADFVKICNDMIDEMRPDFVSDWKVLGMSCDFESSYSTIDPHCIATSQLSFIDLYEKNYLHQEEAPTMWCVSCQTAIAQADLEDAELPSTFNDIHFEIEDTKEKIIIATTRPELLGACVCIFVHPTDKRYEKLVGKKAKVPLFNQIVPIIADESANPEKGSGMLMICSYGDKFDVAAIYRHNLTPRVVFTKDGFLNELAKDYKGLSIKDARKKILEDLEKQGLLINKKNIKHIVNVHERCKNEVEFLTTKQWFIKIIQHKQKLIDAASKINWHPEHMKIRYVHWVENLDWDWCISRQRHFGVPFPVWYCAKCNQIIMADKKDLPVDPLKDKPKQKCKCGSNEFIPEKDVMDTWATSSVSPQIISNWIKNPKNEMEFEQVFPNSLRPQAHDIIRTWAFYTIVKSIYNNNTVPWKNIMISGYIQDPQGRKMSKSLGNVVDPREVFKKFSVDAFRYFSAGSKLGDDVPYQEKELLTGEKLITKMWNASKFALMHLEDFKDECPKELDFMDKWILSRASKTIKEMTQNFENYEYSKNKLIFENLFWRDFCDNYMEIVKDRLYNPDVRGFDGKKSAQYAIYQTLNAILKLSAPVMPYITEEIYQVYFAQKEGKKSIHVSDWPTLNLINEEAEKIGNEVVKIVEHARKAKSEKNVTLKTPITKMVVHSKISAKEFEPVKKDVIAATRAEKIEFVHLPKDSDIDFDCEIELGEPPKKE